MGTTSVTGVGYGIPYKNYTTGVEKLIGPRWAHDKEQITETINKHTRLLHWFVFFCWIQIATTLSLIGLAIYVFQK